MFSNSEVAEYESDGAGLFLPKGFTVYFSSVVASAPRPAPISGLPLSPNLWFGACNLTYPICGSSKLLFTNSIRAFSNTLNEPETISISINFGTISGDWLSR